MTEATVRDILVSIGYTPKDAGTRYSCRPLYRDSNNDNVLSICKESGLWYDFKEGYGGNLQKLIEITLKVSAAEAYQKLKDQDFQEKKDFQEEHISQVKIWPQSCLAKLKQDHRYWIGRNISETVINQFGGGVAEEGKMYFRYVFPIFNEHKKIIGFSGRDILNNNPNRVKWKIIGAKKSFCYPLFLNREDLTEKREVILVESIGDMLSLFSKGIRNVLVTFGLFLHPENIKNIITVNPQRIIIALNNDESGAGQAAADRMKEQLTQYFDEDKLIIHTPQDNDFNSMSLENFKIWEQKLKSYQPQE